MKRRETAEEGLYHVFGKCVGGEMFFMDPEVKEKVIQTFQRAKPKFSFIIQNFTIMDNHYHYSIQTGKGESISDIMHWVLTIVAMYINVRFKRDGHVFGRRFTSVLVKSLKGFIRLFKYINMNPVKAKLVDKAEDWRYGGLWHFKMKNMSLIGGNPEWVYTLYSKNWVQEYRAK